MLTTLTTRALPVEPLTAESFKPFGDVIEACGDAMIINQGRCHKFNDLTRIATDAEGEVAIHIYHTEAIRQPYPLDLLERHPLGSQAFIPLEKQPFFIVVAPDNHQKPDFNKIRCFAADGSQGINYHPGTWHHPLLSVGQGISYLVVDRTGSGHNCDEVLIPEHLSLTVGASL
ncbi:MAG: ureidoglycolate lyase [Endozoicomonas sp.]|uniref:ureidoglycolate lyase n=1 Tax=Endozoicomonas sp. TaxID=1892382 RepID=UPI003D9B5266